MKWNPISTALLVAPIALLLASIGGAPGEGATSMAGAARGAMQTDVRATAVDDVDPSTIEWIDAETGAATYAPLAPLGALRSSVSTAKLPLSVSASTAANCGTTRYKVLYYMPYDDGLKAGCFYGSGGIWSGPTDVDRVVGVCPGVNRGNIHYTMWSGATYWSTMRGPYASNSQCYKFPADGQPVDFDKVQILTYPY